MFDIVTSNGHNVRPRIQVEDVSVRFRVSVEQYSGVKEYAIRWAQRKVVYRELWALKDISFEVNAGEILGILGPNGAGKSTLLRTIARIIHPTLGRVLVHGSVAPMLELGAGFHAELTGRENIFLYGTLLGHARSEIKQMFDEIVSFAELDEFIDTPLRLYSSGMTARLAFAVATARPAQILLIDEVLSVGDLAFQKKSSERIKDFLARGTTVLYVSHDLDSINALCSNALWLQAGEEAVLGPSGEVTRRYSMAMNGEAPGQTSAALPFAPA